MSRTSPVELLQTLIRFDTTNPPGNEAEAIGYLDGVLAVSGITSMILAKDPGRPNLIARLPGRGEAPPFLMQGHIDVVPTTGQQWSRAPFQGEIVDGFLWGRGTLDMKGGVAMMVDAFLAMAASGETPAGDIILCVVSDEEAGGEFGARFLVQEHPELFEGVRHCIGEFGGFPLHLAGRSFYPVQIAERVGVRFELTFRGPGGHGSLPMSGGAMAKLGKVLNRLDRRRMPVDIVPATRMMLEAMIDNTEGTTRAALQALLNRRIAGTTLKLLGSQLSVMEPVLRNTVNATMVHGGDKYNVIPAEISLTLDGRMLPGIHPDQMADELRAIVGQDVEITYHTEGILPPDEPDMSLFPLLAELLVEMDPDAIPIPFLLPAVTDGRWFSQLGIQHYGFLPMRLPPDYEFQATVHAADERIPVAAIEKGAEIVFELLRRYR
ncbi:MAG: M20/M25/M40 family metallo-hydrolase [Acidimicrobiia bacterium]|nr:M20/M25/M40 family metallo-hydrolase [Acidimicrobiia bacterium]